MAITGTTELTNQVQTSYERVALFALRSQVVFDQLVKVKPGDLTNPGTPVTFTFWDDIAVQTSALSEETDVTPIALGDSQTSVTPAEQGAAVQTSAKIRADSFLRSFNPDVANLVAYNMANSMDSLAVTAFDAAGTERYVAASEAATVATDVITATLVRQQHADLKANAVMEFDSDFVAASHPHVLHDLMSETGDAGWLVPSRYNDATRIWNGDVGKFAGFRFLSTPRATLTADGGSTTVDTYTTYFLGREAMAKAVSINPHIVISPVTDLLKRFQGIGWYGYFGYGQLRSASMYRLISASSIGAN